MSSVVSSSFTPLTSAVGLLSLLDESDSSLQLHALQALNAHVDQFWPEIATVIPKIETLVERESFSSRPLASVLVSKVFYHLEALDESLKYALTAGELFDIAETSEYVETLVSKCIDQYCLERQQGKEAIDQRLSSVVERMFERCFASRQFKQALGIAIESRRLDMVRRSIVESGAVEVLLGHCFDLSQRVVNNREFRHSLLQVLVQLYMALERPDYLSMCQALLFLNDHRQVASILTQLIEKGGDEALLAYQIGFDLGENQNQPFLNQVAAALPAIGLSPPVPAPSVAASSDASAVDEKSDSTSTVDDIESRMRRLRSILSGEAATALYLQFLYNNNRTDLNLLKQIKDKLEPRNSVTHNATVMAHGFMHCGTTVDAFLRDNLEWLGKAQNWAKFTATASIGVIHKGHVKESLKLLEPYLPANGAVGGGSPYQEGGALYALGLIHSTLGSDKIDYLSEALRNAGNNEIVQHGACLGLGLTAMATGSETLFETLKGVVMQESAVAGEAAGVAMGLVLLGSGNGVAVEEMLAYAHDTQHEKIIRGLATGIALIQFGREEEADTLIEQLVGDKDALLRYGGMYAIGLAYVGTANNRALQRLLHVAVSDVSDDVRRAAVTNIGFVLCNVPDQVPRVVSLLAESYNPYVRYGAAFAIGIACAGGNAKCRKEALNVLEPLLKDRVDFVRQGAFIGTAMVLIQHNEASEPRLANFRKAINESMLVKSDTMTKLGSILAAGIIDAGGRNCTIELISPAGHKRMAAIVGIALFAQFWYWYPLVHFLSLALSPTAVIGLNKNLEIPKPFMFVSKAPPSQFAYPPPIDLSKAEVKKDKKVATLSVTAKAKAKLKKKEEAAAKDAMDTSSSTEEKKEEAKGESAMEVEEEKKSEEKKSEEKKAEEAKFELLHNPARVTPLQVAVLAFPHSQRYEPVKRQLSAIVMLRDSRPTEAETIVTNKAPKIGIPGVSDDEPEPPKPFEYTGN